MHELRLAAVELLRLRAPLLGPGDLALVERLVRESGTWALVDPLATGVAGAVVDRCGPGDPAVAAPLDRWAADADHWVRRAALLALLPGLRRGEGDFPRFSAYADAMLVEREFFVRKAIGWVLRETGRRRPELVADWLAARVDRVSGVTLREGVKYLPEPERTALLAAYRGRGAVRAQVRSPASSDALVAPLGSAWPGPSTSQASRDRRYEATRPP